MKLLGWYTVIFNLAVIVLFILHAAGMVKTPPFTVREDLAWAVFSVPVLILGLRVIKRPK
ncbi:MAG: hypothetical protein HYX85_00750 [Chloroflexi bacterium]|nr:hypothetical protein [Chloroflexota bacterium]